MENLQVYAKGINGVINNGRDELVIDLVGVDHETLIRELIFETSVSDVLDNIDFDEIADYVAEMSRNE